MSLDPDLRQQPFAFLLLLTYQLLYSLGREAAALPPASILFLLTAVLRRSALMPLFLSFDIGAFGFVSNFDIRISDFLRLAPP